MKGTTQPTLSVAIGGTGVIDESGVVPGIHRVDADIVVKGVRVLPSSVIPEEPSGRGHQEFDQNRIRLRCPSLPVKVHRRRENQFSCVFWGEGVGSRVGFECPRVGIVTDNELVVVHGLE